jgi:two-component system LytT family response regulator
MSPNSSAAAQIRVLVVDDEPPARRRVVSLLSEMEGVNVCGEASNGADAIMLIRDLRPDVVILDIQLPVATGIEVVETIGPDRMPLVIFVTAYDEYAIRAFELNAVDYLLKPVEPTRLSAAIARARHRERTEDAAGLRGAISAMRGGEGAPRIPVRQGGRIRFVEVDNIDFMVADGNYVRLRAGKENHLIRETMSAMEARYASLGFLRIHRALLVRMDRIAELAPGFHGAYSVRLKDGTKLVSGRTYRDKIRQALALGAGRPTA